MQDAPKAVWSLSQNFITYRSSSRPDCIFEINRQWQLGCIPIAAVAVHLNLK